MILPAVSHEEEPDGKPRASGDDPTAKAMNQPTDL